MEKITGKYHIFCCMRTHWIQITPNTSDIYNLRGDGGRGGIYE